MANEYDGRLDKLETKVGELWYLIDILLAHSGLDAEGINRAHEQAATAWNEICAEMARCAADAQLSTEEGRLAQRELGARQRQQARQFWRKDSVVRAGRILPDRSRRSYDPNWH